MYKAAEVTTDLSSIQYRPTASEPSSLHNTADQSASPTDEKNNSRKSKPQFQISIIWPQTN